jgi:hypothetical protein
MEGIIHSDLFAQDRYTLGAVPIKSSWWDLTWSSGPNHRIGPDTKPV